MFDGCLRFYLTTSGLSFLCFRVTYVLYLNTRKSFCLAQNSEPKRIMLLMSEIAAHASSKRGQDSNAANWILLREACV